MNLLSFSCFSVDFQMSDPATVSVMPKEIIKVIDSLKQQVEAQRQIYIKVHF